MRVSLSQEIKNSIAGGTSAHPAKNQVVDAGTRQTIPHLEDPACSSHPNPIDPARTGGTMAPRNVAKSGLNAYAWSIRDVNRRSVGGIKGTMNAALAVHANPSVPGVTFESPSLSRTRAYSACTKKLRANICCE